MEITFTKFLWGVAILLAITLLLVTVGGRTFGELVVTDHYYNEHPECMDSKMAALDPNAHWNWVETLRGPCGIFNDNGTWIVIVCIIIGAGRKAIIKLITGFNPDGNDVKGYLNRPSNRSGNYRRH